MDNHLLLWSLNERGESATVYLAIGRSKAKRLFRGSFDYSFLSSCKSYFSGDIAIYVRFHIKLYRNEKQHQKTVTSCKYAQFMQNYPFVFTRSFCPVELMVAYMVSFLHCKNRPKKHLVVAERHSISLVLMYSDPVWKTAKV